MAPRKCYRIGVIGGGIAGLATASELLRLAETRDEQLVIEVVLFESRSRLGGRLHTDYDTFKTPSGDKFPVDLGAAWVHGINGNPLKDLTEEWNNDLIQASEDVKMLGAGMKVVDEETDKKTDKLFDDILDQAAEDCWNRNEYSSLDESQRCQKAVRFYAASLTNDFSENSALHRTKPEPEDIPSNRYSSDISVDQAIGTALQMRTGQSKLTKEERDLLRRHQKNTEYALGANVNDLSMRFWDADERHAFEGDHVLLRRGYSCITDHMLDRCKRRGNFSVQMNFSVGSIEYARTSTSHPLPRNDGRKHKNIELSDTCRVKSADGKQTFAFDFLVCTLPLRVLKDSTLKNSDSRQLKRENKALPESLNSRVISRHVEFDPALPEVKKDAIQAVGFGLLNKIFLQFSHAFWRNSGTKESLKGTPFLADDQVIFGNASEKKPHHYMFLDLDLLTGVQQEFHLQYHSAGDLLGCLNGAFMPFNDGKCSLARFGATLASRLRTIIEVLCVISGVIV